MVGIDFSSQCRLSNSFLGRFPSPLECGVNPMHLQDIGGGPSRDSNSVTMLAASAREATRLSRGG
jgi:hypothetical protein